MTFILIYLILINLLSFGLYGIDKHRAVKKEWRIKESLLILVAVPFGSLGALLGMHFFHHKTHKKKFTITIPLLLAIHLLVSGGIAVFLNTSYKADAAALNAMNGNDKVNVSHISKGYLFDGPGTENALIFYPGAAVETGAYAPLMLSIAENGVDCVLVDMPFHFAIFNGSAANDISKSLDYKNWFISGHSLGGVVASAHVSKITETAGNPYKGEIFFASYPFKDFSDSSFPMLSIYGTNDMNPAKIKENSGKLSKNTDTIVIEGGNHAQFGNYGIQKKDGTATISAKEQQSQAVKAVISFISKNTK